MGTLKVNGHIEGNQIKSTWLYTSAATELTSTSKLAVINDGWIYYIKPENLTAGYASNLNIKRTISGDSHALALQSEFNSNKANILRNRLNTYYSTAYGNGSVYMGYFLSGYDTNPYGGFFVAHYNNPYYVGISNGSFSQQSILTSSNYTSWAASASHTHSNYASTSHTHSYLPLSGGMMTGNIGYANGSYTDYEMIKFITGTNDGAGIVIGGGGLAVFGSGESASNLVSAASLAGNTEETHITSDGVIYFHTNCQTIANRKTISIDANGAFSGTIAWGNVTGKPSSFTPSAHTDHATLKITSTSATGHLNFSRGNLNYITAPASGYFGFSPNGKGTGLEACDLVIAAGSVYPGINNAVTLGTSSKTWSTAYVQRLVAYSTTDAAYEKDNGTGIQIGASSGTHVIMDNNEVIAKTSATTAGTYYIQSGSGNVEIASGGTTTIGGKLTVSQSDPSVNIVGRTDMGCLRLTNDGWTGYGTADPSGNLTAVVGRVYFKII